MLKYSILLILAIICVPLASMLPTSGQPIWYGQYLGLTIVLLLAGSAFLWDFNKPLAVFTVICLLSTVFVSHFAARSMVLLINLYIGCIAAYGVSKLNKKQRRLALYAICFMVALQLVWVGLQVFNKDPIFKSIYPGRINEIVGFSGSKDQLGTFFAITLPVALHTFAPLALLSIVGLIASKSSFAFIAGISSGIIYIWFAKRRWFKYVTTLAAIAIIVFFLKAEKLQAADFNTRLGVWRYATRAMVTGKIKINKYLRDIEIKSKPFLGYGFGNFLTIFPFVPESEAGYYFNYKNEKFTHAHNDFVETPIFELGLLGILSALALIGNFIYRFVKANKSKELILYFSCIVAYLLNSMGNFVSQIAVSGMFLIIFYGMFEGTRREYGKNSVLV